MGKTGHRAGAGNRPDPPDGATGSTPAFRPARRRCCTSGLSRGRALRRVAAHPRRGSPGGDRRPLGGVCAGLEHLGLIVVDEEHEHQLPFGQACPATMPGRWPSYGAATAGAVLVLGSATPSIATYMRTMPGVRPRKRAGAASNLNQPGHQRPLPAGGGGGHVPGAASGATTPFSARTLRYRGSRNAWTGGSRPCCLSTGGAIPPLSPAGTAGMW